MAEKTSDRVDGETPNGGAYTILYYQDDQGNPTTKAKATAIEAIEFDAQDNQIFRTYLTKGDTPIEPTADPTDTATDTGIDDAAANFAAPKGRGGKGRKKGKGKKNCTKGTNCGGTCISAKKVCRKDNPSPAVKAKAKRGKASKSGGGGGGAEKKTGTPTSTSREDVVKRDIGDLVGSPDRPNWASIKKPKDPETWTNSLNREAVDKQISLALGKDAPEAVAAAEANIKRVLADSEIHIRVPNNAALGGILSDRFKNQFETGTTRGSSNLRQRAIVERDAIGYPPDSPLAARPIYGYLSNPATDSESLAMFYGYISVRLKPEAKARSTYTGSDSFRKQPASPIKTPRVSSLIEDNDTQQIVREKIKAAAAAKDIDELYKSSKSVGYLEAQVHGGVKPKDIAAITYHKGIPDRAVIDWAKKNKVEIIYAK
jgi:hypothetical protein